MAPDVDLTEGDELESKATPAELLDRVRSGDDDAAYELLGRQGSIKAWREALAHLAKAPERADLEVAAHRALRRPQEVVSALIDLAEAVASTRAAFVGRAVAKLRPEEHLIARGTELRDRLLEASDLELLLAADDGDGALYFILAHDLAAQPRLLELVAADPTSSRVLSAALDREYQRLLKLGQTVRWTTGGYRYLLRHSLAHVALLSRASGRTADLAYRLLQQQVESPEENDELVDLLPPETRQTFLHWALERENATAHLARTRFVLAAARRHTTDVDRSHVVAAAHTIVDPETVVDAITTAVSLEPGESDLDRHLAEQLNNLPPESANRLLRSILEIEPKRLRFDLFATSVHDMVIEAAAERQSDILQQISTLLAGVPDPEMAADLINLAERIAERARVPEEALNELARAISARAAGDPRWEHALLSTCMNGEHVRAGLWRIAADIPESLRSSVVRGLIALGEPAANGQQASALLAQLEGNDERTLSAFVDAILEGALDPNELRAAPTSRLEYLADASAARVVVLEQDQAEATTLLVAGEAAAEERLLEGLRPIIDRAIERAHGNERLQIDYRRLLPERVEPTVADDSEELEEIPAVIVAELAKLGARLDVTTNGPVIALSEPNDRSANVRYLAVLDQRLAKAQHPSRQPLAGVLDAYVFALGRVGDAGAIVTDLFDRGPLMRLALGLAASTRELVVRAALANGLELRPTWRDDERLGDWLTTIVDAGKLRLPDQDLASTVEKLERAQRSAAAARATRERFERLQLEAKKSFVQRTLPAFADLERSIDGYVQLWQALSRLGVSQSAALGTTLTREDVDANRHEIVSTAPAERYVVRSAGVVVDGEVLVKAHLEVDDS